MTNKTIETFPVEFPFPIGDYRAIVIDCRADEITEGIVTIYLDLMLMNLQTDEIFIYCDTIVNDLKNPRSQDFFDFLSASYVCFEQYEDLIGLAFECIVTFEQYGETVLPILCNRKILAKPHCK